MCKHGVHGTSHSQSQGHPLVEQPLNQVGLRAGLSWPACTSVGSVAEAMGDAYSAVATGQALGSERAGVPRRDHWRWREDGDISRFASAASDLLVTDTMFCLSFSDSK